MSHFSKVQTSINNINLLKKTLTDLGFDCNEKMKSIKDTSGRVHNVNLIAKSYINLKQTSVVGFFWEHNCYSVVVDLDFWKTGTSFSFFIEQLNQNYAINMILKEIHDEGFQKISQSSLSDGSIKLTVQKWA